jgi:hypothetical protein
MRSVWQDGRRPPSSKLVEGKRHEMCKSRLQSEIGLIVYRRGWLSKRRYCSKHCRDAFVPQKLQQKQGVSTYFEWLFLQPIKNPRLKLKPAVIRTRAD